jgi:hypothetical protein
MAEQEQKKPATTGRLKWRGNGYGRENQVSRGNYKSRVEGLEDGTSNVGALSNPAKFSKLLTNIDTYIQRTYRCPDNIVKALQQIA